MALDLVVALGPDGLLRPGPHPVDPEDLAAFAADPFGATRLRSAVCSGVMTWLTVASERFGPGVGLVGGGFTSVGEPTDTAIVGYAPDDRRLAVGGLELSHELQTIAGVAYSYPGNGGVTKVRWPVSGLVDAFVVDPAMAVSLRKRLSMVVGPDGFAEQGAAKGYLEVGVGRDG